MSRHAPAPGAGRPVSRRTLLRTGAVAGAAWAGGLAGGPVSMARAAPVVRGDPGSGHARAGERSADLVICGGGLGGVAAALAACRHGLRVILTEETDWLGGQLTAQAVPPDEHRWIETHGCTRSYRALREGIRDYYRRHYPLTEEARTRRDLNPGNGAVSRLCHEPRVALAVLESMLAPFAGGGLLTVLLEHRPVGAEVDGDRIRAVAVRSRRSGREVVLRAPWFLDATELGDLLPLAGVEWVIGAEGRAVTGEPHAPEKTDPANQQAFTVCFAMDHRPGEDHTIARPAEYAFWRDYVPRLAPPWPGRLLSLEYSHPRTLEPRRLGFDPGQADAGGVLNLWLYRRIAARANFRAGAYGSDVCLVNWPQNDYLPGPLVGVDETAAAEHVRRAGQLSLSLLYWLQTEVPRRDGGTGWPGLRLRPDVVGTEDGLAKAPYIRESRRIRAVFTIREQDFGTEARRELAGGGQGGAASEVYFDTVGIGHYAVDLHPSTGGDNYIDFDALPFHLPLGALLPERVRNLLPAGKNIGTTHITQGAYRLHPVEWNVGETAGALVAFVMRGRHTPHGVREDRRVLAEFQGWLRDQGVETHWPLSGAAP